MKKQYISPLATIVTINTELTLMTGSLTETLKTTEVSDGDTDFVQCGRSSSIWDDDYEDE